MLQFGPDTYESLLVDDGCLILPHWPYPSDPLASADRRMTSLQRHSLLSLLLLSFLVTASKSKSQSKQQHQQLHLSCSGSSTFL